MTRAPVPHATVDERVALGKAARQKVQRSTHAAMPQWVERPDPIELLKSQASSRVPELVPIRYGRMLVSPFTFFRGAALLMASDLAQTRPSGFDVQLCALARAHARSGDRVAIAAHLGSGTVFDESLADFAERYADQNEADFVALEAAESAGRVVVQRGL